MSTSPNPAKSEVVLYSILLMVLALALAALAFFMPALGPIAIVTALGSLMLAVLSLREDR